MFLEIARKIKMSRVSDAKEVILTSDTTGENWSAAVWDPRNGSLLSVFKNASALSHNTLQLLSDSYVLGADSTKARIHIWPLNNSSPLTNIKLITPGKVNALTCTTDGSYIIAAVGEKLFIWQTCNGKLLNTLVKHYQTITCLCITKDGSLFASGSEDGLVLVWSLYSVLNNKDSSPVYTFSDYSLPVRGLHFGHGSARLRLYTISLDRSAKIYELGNGTLLLSLILDVPLTAVTMDNCESELFLGSTTGDIFQCSLHEPPRVIERRLSSNNEVDEDAIFKGHKSDVISLSVSVDSTTLLSGSTDGAVHIWDIASRQVLRTIQHKGPITAAFFSPGFENFRATTLKPRLQVCSLQRTSDNAIKENVIEVISRGRNPIEILDFQSYVQGGADPQRSDEMTKKLADMEKEIENLKHINTNMYRYSVKSLLEATCNKR